MKTSSQLSIYHDLRYLIFIPSGNLKSSRNHHQQKCSFNKTFGGRPALRVFLWRRWCFEKSFLNESKMLIRRKQLNGGEQKRGLESDKKAEEYNLDSFEKKSIRNPIIGSQLTSRLRKKRNQNGILCQATDSESDISLQLYPWIKDGGNTVNILSW